MNETLDFLTQHGSLVLAAVVFAEQIGLPLPALPFLIAAGALVGTGQMSVGMALVSAVLAAMAGVCRASQDAVAARRLWSAGRRARTGR